MASKQVLLEAAMAEITVASKEAKKMITMVEAHRPKDRNSR